tara:strand:- start:2324 stop:2470 length:147 start_codon:yes stop_codon:yes gene_type:complete
MGVFSHEVEDPEHCNAERAALWELALLRKHYHPTARQVFVIYFSLDMT